MEDFVDTTNLSLLVLHGMISRTIFIPLFIAALLFTPIVKHNHANGFSTRLKHNNAVDNVCMLCYYSKVSAKYF